MWQHKRSSFGGHPGGQPGDQACCVSRADGWGLGQRPWCLMTDSLVVCVWSIYFLLFILLLPLCLSRPPVTSHLPQVHTLHGPPFPIHPPDTLRLFYQSHQLVLVSVSGRRHATCQAFSSEFLDLSKHSPVASALGPFLLSYLYPCLSVWSSAWSTDPHLVPCLRQALGLPSSFSLFPVLCWCHELFLSVWTLFGSFPSRCTLTPVTVQSGQKWTEQMKHFLWMDLMRWLMQKHLQYWGERCSLFTDTPTLFKSELVALLPLFSIQLHLYVAKAYYLSSYTFHIEQV